jgi:hypothetical protein
LSSIYTFYLQVNWPTAELIPRESSAMGSAEAAWAPFVTDMLIGRGNILHALICNKIDGTVYASSPNFTLKTYHANIEQEDGNEVSQEVDEAKNIAMLMKGGASRPAQGLRLNGEEKKYQIIKSGVDDTTGTNIVFGKKVSRL